MPKVLFNIKKLQLSPITSISDTGVPTYGDAIKCPGTVSLTLDPQGESTPFYADGIVYYLLSSSQSYNGSLENALFPVEALTKIFSYMIDSNENIVETDGEVKECGAQFAVDSDEGEVYFTLFRVSLTKPNINFQTNEENKTINPQSVDITASSVPTSDGKYNVIKSYCTKGMKNYSNYFESITVPTISEISEVSTASVSKTAANK